MKTKLLWFALTVSTATIADANPAAYRGAGGNFHRSTVARAAPAARVPARIGSISSMRSIPARSFRGRTRSPVQRYSSVAMRPSRSPGFRRPNMYPSRVTYTRSGPFIAATINSSKGFPRVANRRNPTAATVVNQQNSGRQIRNGNNHLQADWHKHVFAQRSGDWQADWDRHAGHWWNGHRCSFINNVWVIFDTGFDPWWPSYYPDEYYYDYGFPYDGYGSSTYGYDHPYPSDYDPGYYNSGDYQGQYDDQNSYSDQSQGYYDSSVYRTEVYDDPNGYADESQSDHSTIVAAQERLARQGYYRGETDGVLTPEMQNAVKRYQITNGLRATGYLDTQTLAVMGF